MPNFGSPDSRLGELDTSPSLNFYEYGLNCNANSPSPPLSTLSTETYSTDYPQQQNAFSNLINNSYTRGESRFVVDRNKFSGKFVGQPQISQTNEDTSLIEADIEGTLGGSEATSDGPQRITVTYSFYPKFNQLIDIDREGWDKIRQTLDPSRPDYQTGGHSTILNALKPVLQNILVYLLTLNHREGLNGEGPDYEQTGRKPKDELDNVYMMLANQRKKEFEILGFKDESPHSQHRDRENTLDMIRKESYLRPENRLREFVQADRITSDTRKSEYVEDAENADADLNVSLIDLNDFPQDKSQFTASRSLLKSLKEPQTDSFHQVEQLGKNFVSQALRDALRIMSSETNESIDQLHVDVRKLSKQHYKLGKDSVMSSHGITNKMSPKVTEIDRIIDMGVHCISHGGCEEAKDIPTLLEVNHGLMKSRSSRNASPEYVLPLPETFTTKAQSTDQHNNDDDDIRLQTTSKEQQNLNTSCSACVLNLEVIPLQTATADKKTAIFDCNPFSVQKIPQYNIQTSNSIEQHSSHCITYKLAHDLLVKTKIPVPKKRFRKNSMLPLDNEPPKLQFGISFLSQFSSINFASKLFNIKSSTLKPRKERLIRNSSSNEGGTNNNNASNFNRGVDYSRQRYDTDKLTSVHVWTQDLVGFFLSCRTMMSQSRSLEHRNYPKLLRHEIFYNNCFCKAKRKGPKRLAFECLFHNNESDSSNNKESLQVLCSSDESFVEQENSTGENVIIVQNPVFENALAVSFEILVASKVFYSVIFRHPIIKRRTKRLFRRYQMNSKCMVSPARLSEVNTNDCELCAGLPIPKPRNLCISSPVNNELLVTRKEEIKNAKHWFSLSPMELRIDKKTDENINREIEAREDILVSRIERLEDSLMDC